MTISSLIAFDVLCGELSPAEGAIRRLQAQEFRFDPQAALKLIIDVKSALKKVFAQVWKPASPRLLGELIQRTLKETLNRPSK